MLPFLWLLPPCLWLLPRSHPQRSVSETILVTEQCPRTAEGEVDRQQIMSGKRPSKRGGGRAELRRVEGLRMPEDKQGGYQPALGITDEGGTRPPEAPGMLAGPVAGLEPLG